MIPKVEIVQHVYHIVAAIGILFPQLVQYPNLY